jgi:hypothetical protein
MVEHKLLESKFKGFDGFQTHNAILDIMPYEPEVLIVGTFNPNAPKDKSQFFYGRKENNFWYALRNIFLNENLISLKKQETQLNTIFDLCKKLQLSFTDLILKVDCNENEFNLISDEVLEKLAQEGKVVWNTDNIIDFLKKNKSIQYVYFTRQANSIWQEQWNKIIDNNRVFKRLHSPSRVTRMSLDELIKKWKLNSDQEQGFDKEWLSKFRK